MTTVTFRMAEGRITGFDAVGHSGYAEAGADIVCAAVTSAVRLVEATVNDVLGLAASVKIREQDAAILFRLPGGLDHHGEHLPVSADGADGVSHPAPRRVSRQR